MGRENRQKKRLRGGRMTVRLMAKASGTTVDGIMV
jgi:hypothetical protein